MIYNVQTLGGGKKWVIQCLSEVEKGQLICIDRTYYDVVNIVAKNDMGIETLIVRCKGSAHVVHPHTIQEVDV